MKSRILLVVFLCFGLAVWAQPEPALSASQILHRIQKLKVLGSVLYIAAHPDDENTRLITYLANDKLYRTAYLSLTRGDGGQNLIGDEQGIELGLIRTQELLAARRIDGGEQFFTRAFDFGFSKNPDETFEKWNKEKILSDVVWVIRNYRPDVIITRFPTTGEGGHGHHTASAILAVEAFRAAADPKRFPEQLKWVQPWQAKRILWNTFSFGSVNTTDPSQFKVNAGGYNSLLGKSYGELAAESRSQHKSQGFGSAAARGDSYEYFKVLGGEAPQNDVLDGVNTSWNRIGKDGAAIEKLITDIENKFDYTAPQKSVAALVQLYKELDKIKSSSYWVPQKLKEVQQLIMWCSGLFIDAWTHQPYAVQTGNVDIQVAVNNRTGVPANLINITVEDQNLAPNTQLDKNKNYVFSKSIIVPLTKAISQPYWLREKKEEYTYTVKDQLLIGIPDVHPAYVAQVRVNVYGEDFVFEKPVRYKYTDPVKGEIYQPLPVVPPATITTSPHLLIFNGQQSTQTLNVQLHANTKWEGRVTTGLRGVKYSGPQPADIVLEKGSTKSYHFTISNIGNANRAYVVNPYAEKNNDRDTIAYALALRSIRYDHIPAITYFYPDQAVALSIDLKTAGKKIGYIPGAGDKCAQILERMGYDVTVLDRTAVLTTDLRKYDAIITGVRAYNTNEWMNEVYEKLMTYIHEGGNLIVQYNTSNNIGPLRAKIGPYAFNISRNRITDEQAKVKLLDPSHKVFNFPNKIVASDFDGWIQERSIYHADSWDSNLKPLLSMADPGERPHDGSLIVGKYGKGYFTYTGLVFFRQLPAGVPGALRLMANLIALNQEQ